MRSLTRVLICAWVLWTGQYGLTEARAEFTTLAACQTAREQLRPVPNIGYAKCLPAGTKP